MHVTSVVNRLIYDETNIKFAFSRFFRRQYAEEMLNSIQMLAQTLPDIPIRR
jgi:hypothetical protein